jgi:hypothetical protein
VACYGASHYDGDTQYPLLTAFLERCQLQLLLPPLYEALDQHLIPDLVNICLQVS